MPSPIIPITWNQRLNAWDNDTIEALQDRIGRDRVIHSEIATLFAQTLQWAQTHAFDPANTDALMQCWTMMVLGSNIPWKEYDADSGKNFLPTIVQSNPQGVLDYLSRRVQARLKDREQSAAWIAQALHVACCLDAETVAPVLEALTKTWNGDIKRSQDFANAVGEQSAHFPWESMHELHAKFHAYPTIQKAILQWDGLCTAERMFQSASKTSLASDIAMFEDTGVQSAFHAHTLALTMSGAHLARRWGIASLAAGEVPDAISRTALNAMESAWKMLRVAAEQTELLCDRSLLQQAASWCMDNVPRNSRVIRYEKADAVLLGHKPYFTEAIQNLLALYEKKGESVGVLILQVVTYSDPVVKEQYKAFLASSAKEYLLDFMERAGNSLVEADDVPLLMAYLSKDNVLESARDDDTMEQRLFWRVVSEPEHLNEHTRRELVQTPDIKNAILLHTLMESYGVEHWGIKQDHTSAWANALPEWYPESILSWEHVLRETLRWPDTAKDTMLEAVLAVQGVPRERWTVMQHLVDEPAPNRDPRQAMAQVRSWNLGLPQSGRAMAWAMDALHAPEKPDITLALPALDAAPGL